MKKTIKISGIVLLTLTLIIGVGFFVYASDYERATEPALTAMLSNEVVTVDEQEDYIVYAPTSEVKAGLVFYPGGKVEPIVYSRIFSELARHGVQTVVVKMPFNLAMFNINGADGVIETYNEIEDWYMGGHSLGGVFATEYLKDRVADFEGMVYMASYPNSDLSDSGIRVLSLSGSLDSVINGESYDNAKALLPSEARYVEILGGNHSQFGDYGLQSGDTPATISAEDQQATIVNEILGWMTYN